MIDINSMITPYNIAVTDTTSEILGKECRRKEPRVTRDVLDLFDEGRDLKKSGIKKKERKNTEKLTRGFRRP